jgi:hypothetical protein
MDFGRELTLAFTKEKKKARESNKEIAQLDVRDRFS